MGTRHPGGAVLRGCSMSPLRSIGQIRWIEADTSEGRNGIWGTGFLDRTRAADEAQATLVPDAWHGAIGREVWLRDQEGDGCVHKSVLANFARTGLSRARATRACWIAPAPRRPVRRTRTIRVRDHRGGRGGPTDLAALVT